MMNRIVISTNQIRRNEGLPRKGFERASLCGFVAGVCLVSGCALPRSAVLLFREHEPARIKVSEPPPFWQGRLIRSRAENEANAAGGEVNHRHLIAHQHEGMSDATEQAVRPLGIREVTADRGHVHVVKSVSTEPAYSAPTEAMPPSFGLRAVILQRSILSRTPSGLIVGYVGSELPPGWHWCDGENSTPDLRERYIQLNGDLGPRGSPDHAHDASHGHTWATAENGDQPAYFGDPAPGERPVQVAQRVHRHSPGAESVSKGQTDRVPNLPPAFGVRFIMVSTEGTKIPSGAILPYVGARAPQGWRSISTRFGKDAVGRLLHGSWLATTEPRLSGTLLHSHQFRSVHEFPLDPVSGNGGTDLAGNGPNVPTADHRHRVRVETETETGPDESWPPFVELLIIIKS